MYPFISHCNFIFDPFILNCGNGFLERAKILYNDSINIHAYDEIAFRKSCENGYENVAKWLYEISQTESSNNLIDIHILNNYAFRYSASNGHIELASWLITLGANPHDLNDNAFIMACGKKRLDVVKWLYDTFHMDIHVNNNEPIREACNNNNLDIAKYLYEKGANINVLNNYNFKTCVNHNYLDLAIWLQKVGNIDVTLDNDYCFKTACRNNYIELARWLQSFDKERYRLVQKSI